MPSKVPRVTGEEACKAFYKAGFVLHRVSGSHHILKNDAGIRLSVPVHKGKTIGIGLLAKLIKDANLTVDAFTECL